MSENESIGSFLKENKSLAKDYLETRLEIFRLSGIRMASKSAGYLVWLFVGVTIGFWLSKITDSFILGFGIVAVALILLFVILTVFRKKLFLDPLMQVILDRASEEIDEEEEP
jgi:hypothetical protein